MLNGKGKAKKITMNKNKIKLRSEAISSFDVQRWMFDVQRWMLDVRRSSLKELIEYKEYHKCFNMRPVFAVVTKDESNEF